MKNTNLKVSGSINNPYSNLYLKRGKNLHSLKVFLFFHRYKVHTIEGGYYFETHFGFTNTLPTWLQKVLQFKDEVNQCIEYTEFEGEKAPNWFKVAFDLLKSRRKTRNCKHENMIHESHCNTETGGETFHCPDCGFYHEEYYF